MDNGHRVVDAGDELEELFFRGRIQHDSFFAGYQDLAGRLERPIDGVLELLGRVRLNEQLASYEQVKKFRLLQRDFSIEDGELTPTLKVKRRVVVDKYRELLEAMYAA